MTQPTLKLRLSAEALGSFFLFATVIGSGIMAANLSGGNVAVALLANTLATGAILFVLITMLGPISGAHMNPAVSLVAASRGELRWADAAAYIVTQLAFGILGAWAAHASLEMQATHQAIKNRFAVCGLSLSLNNACAGFPQPSTPPALDP
jgi:glycerol uptake facilitator-like aquaporin